MSLLKELKRLAKVNADHDGQEAYAVAQEEMKALLEARDLVIAKAVRDACKGVADSEREAIQELNLPEIIKGVK